MEYTETDRRIDHALDCVTCSVIFLLLGLLLGRLWPHSCAAKLRQGHERVLRINREGFAPPNPSRTRTMRRFVLVSLLCVGCGSKADTPVRKVDERPVISKPVVQAVPKPVVAPKPVMRIVPKPKAERPNILDSNHPLNPALKKGAEMAAEQAAKYAAKKAAEIALKKMLNR